MDELIDKAISILVAYLEPKGIDVIRKPHKDGVQLIIKSNNALPAPVTDTSPFYYPERETDTFPIIE